MVDDKTIQPGCNVSKSLWERFRKDVEERRGRVNGCLGNELEAALEAYLEGSAGGDVTDELRRLNEDVDEIKRMIDQGGRPTPDGGTENKKNSSRGKDTPNTDTDGDSVGYAGDGEDRGERSVVERRTDAALAELVNSNPTQFTIADLDDAIETGAGVSSRQSIKDYRERVVSRLANSGGMSDIVHPRTESKPLGKKVFFTDPDDAAIERATYLVTERGADVEYAVEKTGADADAVRDQVEVLLDDEDDEDGDQERDDRLDEITDDADVAAD